MNAKEAVDLCQLVAALCPSQEFDRNTPKAWALVLDDITFQDAAEAVQKIYKQPLGKQWTRKIEPAHIRDQVRATNQELIERELANWEPPSGLNPAEYQAWLKETIQRIKRHEQPQQQALESRPMPQLSQVFRRPEGDAA